LPRKERGEGGERKDGHNNGGSEEGRKEKGRVKEGREKGKKERSKREGRQEGRKVWHQRKKERGSWPTFPSPQ
jgi:hypothetical protein